MPLPSSMMPFMPSQVFPFGAMSMDSKTCSSRSTCFSVSARWSVKALASVSSVAFFAIFFNAFVSCFSAL
jgi:hypothetical protein